MGVVNVLCYRDYTREGKRVNTHSLYVKGVKLPKTTSQGEQIEKYTSSSEIEPVEYFVGHFNVCTVCSLKLSVAEYQS